MLPVGRGEDDLRGLYKRVKKAMVGIHQLDHTNNIKELERIATEWSVESTPYKAGSQYNHTITMC